MNIDQYAYSNRLKTIHPAEKVSFGVITLAICLLANSISISILILVMMAALVVLGARIPGRSFAKLMILPVSFLVMGVLSIAISVIPNASDSLYGVTLWGYTFGTTIPDLLSAANLFFQALGSVSCLYFISLTTPMVDLIWVLRKCRVPPLAVELITLIYRFIFVLLETVGKIATSQSSRLGYATLKNSYFSLGQLVSNLFFRAYHRSQQLTVALLSRGYTGQLNVLETQYNWSRRNWFFIGVVDLSLVFLTFLIRGDMID